MNSVNKMTGGYVCRVNALYIYSLSFTLFTEERDARREANEDAIRLCYDRPRTERQLTPGRLPHLRTVTWIRFMQHEANIRESCSHFAAVTATGDRVEVEFRALRNGTA